MTTFFTVLIILLFLTVVVTPLALILGLVKGISQIVVSIFTIFHPRPIVPAPRDEKVIDATVIDNDVKQ